MFIMSLQTKLSGICFKETSTKSQLVPPKTWTKKCFGSAECLNLELDLFSGKWSLI